VVVVTLPLPAVVVVSVLVTSFPVPGVAVVSVVVVVGSFPVPALVVVVVVVMVVVVVVARGVRKETSITTPVIPLASMLFPFCEQSVPT
jgi:hypothetical protein